ncbi:hypothetical protein P7H16_00495 [Paenibacillus larvae]|nr:hypothetical protein [Paenibacillus larvae]MDT2245789.1 hypothetical protein [Paenibacillus larvae]MDT2263853.1 hypothetical protein [Paenibacillus larvae]MDT2285821.1 hypothetical protein [Paenibacillus larvae]MDT2304322.1 hypothetical protein [Paenibacillus larvae]
MKRLTLLLLRTLVLVPVLMAGCGGKPKHDVVMFMMGSSGFPVDIVTKLETSLKEKVGEDVSLLFPLLPCMLPKNWKFKSLREEMESWSCPKRVS